ncbi:undecaprenyldiphospho-muramoylpentapeptide beta-N-acetylglucosaminyltransferase [Limnohabitans sp.]|uniref:undecaprenyldiphospho-muramoylpentapeptide beta-N-acetylglucosaminyltransferase n=1 Tax=Limnohabitans sp. TaxID=1907725 RepID=UPI00286F1628|nr:undecaprenyldiphospho-muramoylpentapeptide beta-N-acetylglucosaminyltransferase [Limnohabitans sp.]
MTQPRTALIMAGGTGGHIFPGLAVADALRAQGWRVHWLGAPEPSMESQLVPPRGFAYEAVQFAGVRGKGLKTLALLPFKLLRAFWQSLGVMRRIKPDVVVGLGGYITFPAGLMAVLCGKPLVLHEQNSVAGMANKVLSHVADRVFSAFPHVLPKAEWVGNPMRDSFVNQPGPAQRFAERTGPLRVVVVGGSLGAQALNTVVPQAVAKMPADQRPIVTHQSGAKQIDALRAAYEQARVHAELTPFIDDTAQAFADADVVVARAGASTVTELAAVGVAAIYVPFPHAVDDHQTTNARFIVEAGGGWLMPQNDLKVQDLADRLQFMTRRTLLACAEKAYAVRQVDAVRLVVAACEQLAAQRNKK